MLTKQQSWTNVRERVTPEEWEQRVALAAAYRLVAHFRWDDLIFTHLSARVPGPEHHFLINPYGMTFERSHRFKPGKGRPRWQQGHGFAVRDQPGGLYHSQRHPCRT
jgi:hypothetical protein